MILIGSAAADRDADRSNRLMNQSGSNLTFKRGFKRKKNMKIRFTHKLLVLVPLLAILAGCASPDNKGGKVLDEASMGDGNGPGQGHGLDVGHTGSGVTRQQ